MEIEHLQAIFYSGSVGSSALHEERLDRVIDGIFGLANRLYGITFKENKDIQVY